MTVENKFNKILREKNFLILALSFSVLANLLWILIIPYNDANDEYNHYNLARFIADERRLPVFNKDDYTKVRCDREKFKWFGKMIEAPICQGSYSIFPFPSYVISALFIAPIPKNAPYRYIFARLPNLLYFAVFLFLVWVMLKKLFSSEYARRIALIAVAFIPQITFVNSYVNSDGFSLAVGALVFYSWIKCADQGLTRKNIIVGSIALGLLASAKYNYFILFPATLIFFLLSYKRFGWKNIFKFFETAAVGIILISGWWFARNYALYGDALGFSTVKKTFTALAPDSITAADTGLNFFSVLLTTNWPVTSFQSFFAVFGWMSIYLPNIFYAAVFLFFIIAAFGWLFYFIDLKIKKQAGDFCRSKFFPFFIASIFSILGAIALSVWTCLYNDFQPQGRYLFPALIPSIIGAILGLRYFSRTIKFNEKIILLFFAAWMNVMWFFSYLTLLFYYETMRINFDNASKYFFYYEKMIFVLQNDFLRMILLATGSVVLILLFFKIWRNILPR